jgi:hypothetical protein
MNMSYFVIAMAMASGTRPGTIVPQRDVLLDGFLAAMMKSPVGLVLVAALLPNQRQLAGKRTRRHEAEEKKVEAVRE